LDVPKATRVFLISIKARFRPCRYDSVMERRTARRYPLELPLSLTRVGNHQRSCLGLTRNISSSGVLFLSGIGLESGDVIQYTIGLADDRKAVSVRCLGTVVRSEPVPPTDSREPGGHWIAATLERYSFSATAGSGAMSSEWSKEFRLRSFRPRRTDNAISRPVAAARL
jgi:hypothetical protein